jgi:hypothetical protein
MFCVWMQLTTSVKSMTTSLPTVMAAMTFLTASFFFSILGLESSSLSSWISPFLVVWKYFESLPEADVPPKLGSFVFMALCAAPLRPVWNHTQKRRAALRGAHGDFGGVANEREMCRQ